MRGKVRSQKLRTKIMMWYITFALLPMILIMIYVYFYTSQLILSGMNRNMDYQIERIGQSLDDKSGNYYTISNMLYTDETLWNYLTADYTRMGYEDLYLYVDTLFLNIRMLYPEILSISVCSTNSTLPKDDFYFYVINEAEANERFPQIGGIMQMEKGSDGNLSFSRFMNRYETGRYRNYLTVSVGQEEIYSILETGEEGFCIVLINEEGIVQISNRAELQGKQINELGLENQVVRRRSTKHCGELILYADTQLFRKPVKREAVKIFSIFVLCAGCAFIAIAHWSRRFQENVENVMKGAGIISYGNFGHRILYTQKDEIGMIADSVNKLAERIQETIEESYEKELRQKISEMNQLQEQINPHFLYNALSSISSMAINNGDRETALAIVCLADFYRLSLNKGNQELTICDEFKILDSYMKLQKIRFGESIMLEYLIDEGLLDHKIMKLTLQPIVENAIHHGRTDDVEVFHILIRLYGQDGKTIIEIIDDGKGISPEKMMELQESMDRSEGGYGLRNVNIRLKMQYGDEYGINLESELGFGTKVRIELPG